LLLEDGIPLAFAPYGDNAAYYHPSFKRYDRIEILKGASQVRFGPQTIGGVINYITPKAPETFTGKLLASAGSQNYSELEAMVGGAILGGRGLIHAQSKQSDSSRKHQDLQVADIFAKMEWDLGRSHTVTARISRNQEDSKVSYSGLTLAEFQADPFGNPFENDRFNAQRVGMALSHAWFIDNDTSLKSTLYGSHFSRDWWRQSSNSSQRPNDSSDPACATMANLNTSCGNEGRLRDYWVWGIETRIMHQYSLLGVQVRSEAGLRFHAEHQHRRQWNGDMPTARSPGIGVNGGVREDNERLVEAASGFVTSQFTFANLVIEPGIRFEHIDYERLNRLNGVKGATSVNVAVPGLGLVYKLGKGSVIYAGVHKGYAPPRVEDIINSTTGITVDLKAEESVNWEFGIRGDLTTGLYVDAAYFRMDFANQIVPQSVAGGAGATLTSAGETLHQGFEFLARASARQAGWIKAKDDVYARLSATYVMDAAFEGVRFSTVTGFGTTSVAANRLPYAPKWLLAAALGYQRSELLSAEVEAQYTGEMFTDDLNSIAVISSGQRGLIKGVMIFNTAVNIKIPDTSLTMFVTGKNLTDELYVVDRVRGILPGNRRSFHVGVVLDF
jgi:Fe(3+) dicitrate transport protein